MEEFPGDPTANSRATPPRFGIPPHLIPLKGSDSITIRYKLLTIQDGHCCEEIFTVGIGTIFKKKKITVKLTKIHLQVIFFTERAV